LEIGIVSTLEYFLKMKNVGPALKKTKQMQANAALFNVRDKPNFITDAILHCVTLAKIIVVSEDAAFMPSVPQNQRLGFAVVRLDRVLIEPDDVFAMLKQKSMGQTHGFVVDMRWANSNSDALRSLEQWGSVAEQFSDALKKPVISVYDLGLIIEEQLQTALRVHSQILAASGLYKNPYWLPAKLLNTATLDEQLAFMLGRVVPDHEGRRIGRHGNDMARGATPSWLARTDTALGASAVLTRWQIHCFGSLRVFIGGHSISWRIAGGAPKKTQTLFAYLLQCGAKGANAEQISELLWPDEESDATKKRARLHHSIAMLRKILGFSNSVIRAGDNYRLNAPTGSWIDINTFEQMCRRGLLLSKKGELESALRVYLAADQLYAGDLFEDLPREYVESENENWCMPRRMWLREMALKLQNDTTSVFMRLGRTREALDHCLKALAIDPASEIANDVAMQIFAVQGREDAVHRQFKQYQQAVKMMGERESMELRTQYSNLISKEKPKNVD
jgi:DNA-binding SARP family transcriptional activator